MAPNCNEESESVIRIGNYGVSDTKYEYRRPPDWIGDYLGFGCDAV